MKHQAIAASCDGKRPMTFRDAKKAAGNHDKRHRAEVVAYKCKFCGFWHVGGNKIVRAYEVQQRRNRKEKMAMDDE